MAVASVMVTVVRGGVATGSAVVMAMGGDASVVPVSAAEASVARAKRRLELDRKRKNEMHVVFALAAVERLLCRGPLK